MTGKPTKPAGKPAGRPKSATKSTKPRRKNETVNISDKSVSYYDEEKKETKKIPLNRKQQAEFLYSKKLNLKCKNKKQKDFLITDHPSFLQQHTQQVIVSAFSYLSRQALCKLCVA